MMRIVEKSSDHLRLSDAETLWSKWGFVAGVVAVLLSGILISALVLRPPCWSGVVIGGFLLFMWVRELPRSSDTEFCFDRAGDQLQVITRRWLGRPEREHYPLSDITEVRVVARAMPRNYPGHDYDDAETNPPEDNPEYDVKLVMRSGATLTVAGGCETTGIAASIAEFLAPTSTTA
jgi:hypothetical protein